MDIKLLTTHSIEISAAADISIMPVKPIEMDDRYMTQILPSVATMCSANDCTCSSDSLIRLEWRSDELMSQDMVCQGFKVKLLDHEIQMPPGAMYVAEWIPIEMLSDMHEGTSIEILVPLLYAGIIMLLRLTVTANQLNSRYAKLGCFESALAKVCGMRR